MAKDSILSPKTGNKARMSTLSTSIQHLIGSPSQYNRTRNKKGINLNTHTKETVSIHRKYEFSH